MVSGNYFDVLGVGAVAGRTLTPADDHSDGAPVAVIGHGYWQSQFGGDPAIYRLVFWRSVRVLTVAVPVGLFAGWAVARQLSSLLFQVGAVDVAAYLSGAACLLTVAFVAAYVPAYRAAATTPASAFRFE